MSKLRYLPDVIQAMLALIPAEQSTELRERLEWIRNKTLYTAPEVMGHLWDAGTKALYKAFGEHPQGWQRDVMKLWNPHHKW